MRATDRCSARALDDLELDRYTATARALFFKASYLLHF